LKRVELIETSTFTRQITALLGDEDYGAFQPRLAIQVSALSLKVAAEYAIFAKGLVRAASVGLPRHLTTPEERVGRSDPEAGAVRQSSQGGVQR